MRNKKQILESLESQGFDSSYISGQGVRVGCSQCQALCINGTATHETGCSNVVHECQGCSERVERFQRYCVDCS
jgi:hypothetical protein